MKCPCSGHPNRLRCRFRLPRIRRSTRGRNGQISAAMPPIRMTLPQLFEQPVQTLRWYLWHGNAMTAATTLKVLQIDCDCLPTKTKNLRETVRRVKAQGWELASYLSNNFDTLVNYGHLYRNSLPISSSRTDGCVDEIGNARIGKRAT